MGWRVFRINQEVKSWDRDLCAKYVNGMIQVWRVTKKLQTTLVNGHPEEILQPYSQFLFALTEDWTLRSRPIEWGIEPVMEHLRNMDSWRDDSYFDKMRKRREMDEEDERRKQKNEFRAVALDVRRDFAKATNDIVVRH